MRGRIRGARSVRLACATAVVLAVGSSIAVVGLPRVSTARGLSPKVAPGGPNLIVNGDAESGAAAGSGYDTVVIPGWQIAGEPTVVRYGQHADGITGTGGLLRGAAIAGAFPTSATPGPPDRGRQLFVGGQVGSDTLTQRDSVARAAAAIDRGGVGFTLSGWLGGNGADASAAAVSVTWLNARGASLHSAAIPPVTPLDRLLQTRLEQRTAAGTIPIGARAVLITLTLTDATPPNKFLANSYNNAYADQLSLHISAPLAAPAAPTPPPSRIGHLDHVFMVFMENEGYNDILGNPQAPYLNSLISRHGSATDYHGVEHPSDDNYVAFFGGSTYGIDANCSLKCPVSQRNLADEVEAAHRSWAFYEETMPSSCYPADAGPKGSLGSYYTPDLLPWVYFTDLLGNVPRCHAHDFPLAKMTRDLRSTQTTPNYVWFEADDNDDMEQGGISAGDQWLSRTLPTILGSPAFRRQRSAVFITWDEDFNNKTFNQDNQDNRVPMIVIASRASGMRAGPVRDPAYLTHYSLLRTIELALGLPTLTLNDRFATPLNGFWPAVPVLSGLRARRSAGRVTFRYRDTASSLTTLTILNGRRIAGSFKHRDHRGLNTVRLPVGLAKRPGGRYRLRATPANAAGVIGAPITTRF
jgi:Phosphoesterase family